jgi:hypothetical protein
MVRRRQQQKMERIIVLHARQHPHVGRTFKNDSSARRSQATEMQEGEVTNVTREMDDVGT